MNSHFTLISQPGGRSTCRRKGGGKKSGGGVEGGLRDERCGGRGGQALQKRSNTNYTSDKFDMLSGYTCSRKRQLAMPPAVRSEVKTEGHSESPVAQDIKGRLA